MRAHASAVAHPLCDWTCKKPMCTPRTGIYTLAQVLRDLLEQRQLEVQEQQAEVGELGAEGGAFGSNLSAAALTQAITSIESSCKLSN